MNFICFNKVSNKIIHSEMNWNYIYKICSKHKNSFRNEMKSCFLKWNEMNSINYASKQSITLSFRLWKPSYGYGLRGSKEMNLTQRLCVTKLLITRHKLRQTSSRVYSGRFPTLQAEAHHPSMPKLYFNGLNIPFEKSP